MEKYGAMYKDVIGDLGESMESDCGLPSSEEDSLYEESEELEQGGSILFSDSSIRKYKSS
jgi:hypothetical protein